MPSVSNLKGNLKSAINARLSWPLRLGTESAKNAPLIWYHYNYILHTQTIEDSTKEFFNWKCTWNDLCDLWTSARLIPISDRLMMQETYKITHHYGMTKIISETFTTKKLLIIDVILDLTRDLLKKNTIPKNFFFNLLFSQYISTQVVTFDLNNKTIPKCTIFICV